MNLFGLEGIGFIISLAMTLLVSGAIMFYCLRRFKILENSIVEQGKVLQSFIIKSQNNSPTELASSIALNSAIEQSKLKSELENSKIEVSDDESDYSDDDSEEDIKIYPETEEKEITLTTQEINIGTLDNIEEVNLGSEDIKTVAVADITDMLITENNKNDSGEESDQDSDDSDQDSVKDNEPVEEITDSSLEKNNSDNSTKKSSGKNLSKMKVDDLRDLALKDSLETVENLKNMKKDRLLKLFNKN
jgi:hypothetical protein